MKWLVKNFGGNFGKMVDARYSPARVCYRWWASNNRHVLRFLSLVLPYLVVKSEQAKLLLSFVGLEGEHDTVTREDLFTRIRKCKETACVTTEVPDTLVKRTSLCAYLSGFVDGDGSIRVVEHRPQGRKSVIQPTISVGCTDKFVPLVLHKMFNGGFRECKVLPGCKPVFSFTLCHRQNAERCLLYLLPYLIVQRDRAKVVLDLCRVPDDGTPESRQKREELFSEYTRLKRQSKLTGDCERRPAKTQKRKIQE